MIQYLLPSFFVLALFAMCGCCQRTSDPDVLVVRPTKTEISWFQYPEGERVFMNQAGEFDTLIAMVNDSVFDSHFVLDPAKEYMSCETYFVYSYLGGVFHHKSGTDTTTVSYMYSRQRRPDGSNGNVMYFIVENGASTAWNLPARDTMMTVGNIWYDDVSVIDSVVYSYDDVINNAVIHKYSLYFSKAYYSRSQGYVKYISPNGDVWELIN